MNQIAWQPARKIIHYIGAAVCEGQPIKGVEKAPDALRQAGLFKALESYGLTVKDHGNVSIKDVSKEEIKEENKGIINNIEIIQPILHKIYDKVKSAAIEAKKENGFVLTIGGDHSIASASISALKEVYPDLKVIWIDAHGDIIIPSKSDYHNYHGMPVSHVMNLIPKEDINGFDWMKTYIKTDELVFFGVRDIDNDEKLTLKENKIKCFTPDHIHKNGGIGNCLAKAIKFLDPENKGYPIHVSFDIDGCDPSLAPGTGTKGKGGLDYRETMYIMRTLQQLGNFVSMDLVEINPDLDPQGNVDKIFGDHPDIEGTQTVFFGCDIILSAFSKTNLFLDDIE